MAEQKIIDELKMIFVRHKHERVCVLGTICCGKTTLLRQISDCVDLDDVFWPRLTKEEAAFISQTPWTQEISDEIDRLIYEKVAVQVGHPLFTTVILDCEAVVYLDIDDELLAEHCRKRNVSFEDAKNVKTAVESDLVHHKLMGGKKFYTLSVKE